MWWLTRGSLSGTSRQKKDAKLGFCGGDVFFSCTYGTADRLKAVAVRLRRSRCGGDSGGPASRGGVLLASEAADDTVTCFGYVERCPTSRWTNYSIFCARFDWARIFSKNKYFWDSIEEKKTTIVEFEWNRLFPCPTRKKPPCC